MNFIPGQDIGNAGSAEENVDSSGEMDASFIATEKKPQASPAMLVMLGLAVVGAGAYFLLFKNGPQHASAAAVNAPDAVTTFLSNGEQHMQLMKQMLKSTDKVVQQFRTYPSRTQVPLDKLQTNPFRVSPDDASTAVRSNRELDEERAAAASAVERLKLQSILHGGKVRACMINNSLYSQGQQVEQFLIERINPDSVIVRTGAFRFELEMDR